MVLAVDTTSEIASLALHRDGKALAERELHSTEGFAHLIFPAIEQLLKSSGVALNEIDCFAAASGPGSFTGVRVGLAAVKGLAEATGKPAAGISNLRALSSFGNLPVRAVVLDARRGDVFTAVYNAEQQMTQPEAVMKFSAWLESLHLPSYEFIWPNGAPFRSMLLGTRFDEMPSIEAPRALAKAIAFCAEIDGQKGQWRDPVELDANYVRRSDAELFWRDACELARKK
ncbi:MAG: tRNA (adenosine(37)-N6)-threonylcarbamoyltransferase complex dimerization subunit type 1 TsaB [Acidobacteriaceae bacterium]|nr:tRNA (adenosine(37)-N6)-threonylcarbamoyltransferase complex dimerization subunit type 1 TsaB [Acidobacteriaceae bacterium]MBV9778972.1 tRNA (adenosine(37)-N6)-threonylcarbamoyltransferase complex dimerization subunit type 1 TsaB [Acidobacteriaceae bacterium]